VTEPRVRRIDSEEEMLALGGRLAADLRGGQLITLSGDLGAGKTTLVRGMLRGLGFSGRVKSPSYGLVESYELDDLIVHHLDLYRLGDPDELDFLGLEDLLGDGSVVLVEWPERAAGRLPRVDRRVAIEVDGSAREIAVEDSS
jgi:tRNA threonylcarbamoyladenosine biosynthesis protein TsaE